MADQTKEEMRTIAEILKSHDWMGGEYDRPERFIPIIRELLLEGYRKGCDDYANAVIVPYHENPPSRDQMRAALVKVRDSKKPSDFQ